LSLYTADNKALMIGSVSFDLKVYVR